MAASRYEGECKHCGVVASAKDRERVARAPSAAVLLRTTKLARHD